MAEHHAEDGEGAQGVDGAVAVGRGGGVDPPDEFTHDGPPRQGSVPETIRAMFSSDTEPGFR